MLQKILQNDLRRKHKTPNLFQTSLFTRLKRKGESELVLANNAGIFGVYWAMNYHGRNEHQNTHLVCFPCWQDRIHPAYKNCDWGQTMLGFPSVVRSVFEKMYPNYPINKRVTFGMVKDAREFAINELKATKGIFVHDLRHTSYALDFLNEVTIKQNDANIQLYYGKKIIVAVPDDTEIYNWLRVLRHHKLNFFPERPHSELYMHAPENAPESILVIGDGLSIVWLKRDFPDCEIIAIVPDNHVEFPKVPANSNIKIHEIIKIKADDLLDINNDSVTIKMPNKTMRTISMSNFFSAIGYTHCQDLTTQISNEQKIDRIKIAEGSWVAPQNVPVGSLTQSLCQYFQETENIEDTFEFQFYHTPMAADQLQKFFNGYGIELKLPFFKALRDKIAHMEDPLDQEKEREFFINVFKESQNPSNIEIDIFRQAMFDHQNNKLNFIHHQIHNTTNKQSNTSGARLYSTFSIQNHEVIKLKILQKSLHRLVSTFFKPSKEAIKIFDEECSYEENLLKIRKQEIRAVLADAKESQTTFSIY